MSDLLFSREASFQSRNYLLAISINEYDHEANLYNCVKDGEDLIRLLTEDFEFERENVRFICGGELSEEMEDVVVAKKTNDDSIQPADATRDTILDTMYKLSKEIQEESEKNKDLKINLILYYSGHGWYDEFLDQGYWIPCNAEKGNFSKYISNSTIRDYLNSFKTHHTFLIADSCFSGSLFMSGQGKSIATTRLEKDASRWGISAGRNEVVEDGQPGQNSPFLDAIMEELRKTDIMAVQSLCTKVLEKVAANKNQTPRGEPLRIVGHKGGQFVFRKKNSARKYFEAGKRLMELAEFQPEYERYCAANNQFSLAYRLFKKNNKREELVDLAKYQARALCAMGRLEEAASLLEETYESLAEEELKNKLIPLLTYIFFLLSDRIKKRGDIKLALEKTTKYLEIWLKNKPQLPSSSLPALLKISLQNRIDKIYLLSIGINEYQNISSLAGCKNDTEWWKMVLVERFGKNRIEVTTLYDKKATKEGIISALHSYRSKLEENDLLVVHYSGHSMSSLKTKTAREESPYLVPYDADGEVPDTSITSEELHSALQNIEGKNKLIILDSDANEVFLELAKKGNYSTFCGTRPGELAHEMKQDGKSYGAFSYYLGTTLRKNLPPKAAKLRLERKLLERFNQKPSLINEDVFLNLLSNKDSLFVILDFLFGAVQSYKPAANIQALERIIRNETIDFSAQESVAMGRVFVRHGLYYRAAEMYEHFLENIKEISEEELEIPVWRIRLDLVQVYLELAELPKALACLYACKKELEKESPAIMKAVDKLILKIKNSVEVDRYALLVGINTYPYDHKVLKSTLKDLNNWQAALEGMGYQHIKVLANEEATRENILKAYSDLAEKAVESPAFFFYGGLGTANSKGRQRALIPFDFNSRKGDEISLRELAEISQDARHLSVVLDTGFSSRGHRYLDYEEELELDLLGEENPSDYTDEEFDDGHTILGNACIISGAKEHRELDVSYACWETEQGGKLSQHLIKYMKEHKLLSTDTLVSTIDRARIKINQ